MFTKNIKRWLSVFSVAAVASCLAAVRLRARKPTKPSHQLSRPPPGARKTPIPSSLRHFQAKCPTTVSAEMFGEPDLDSYLNAVGNLGRLVVLYDQACAARQRQKAEKGKKSEKLQTPEIGNYLTLLARVGEDFKDALDKGCPMSLIQQQLMHLPNQINLDLMEVAS